MHCASVGEFEQGRPLLEAIRKHYPQYKIVLSFFSPSGYELHKNNKCADYIFYLPLDGRSDARNFISCVQPVLAIFIKYEFWHYYSLYLQKKHIPFVLVSGAFRKEQIFFRSYGGLFRKILQRFSFFFVQDVVSEKLLNTLGITNVSVTGDTRYDRVVQIAALAQTFPLIERWRGSARLFIAGSTWPSDEQILTETREALPKNWKLIIAPHEVNNSRIRQIRELFGKDTVLYSELSQKGFEKSTVLIIDNIGMLSSLYRYGAVAFVGGGFQSGGIHNTLEPAVFGLPVIMGPAYKKFVEARDLVQFGFAYPVHNVQECISVIQNFAQNEELLTRQQENLRRHVSGSIGATEKIIKLIGAKYLD